MQTIYLGELPVEVTHKKIKNIHLSVNPPNGRVRVSVPLDMSMETIRVFVISKISWIKQQQTKLANQEREAPREFIERESHYFKGKRYLLRITETESKPKVEISHTHIHLFVRPDYDRDKRQSLLYEWYRQQLKIEIPILIKHYEKLMNVIVFEFGVKRMKTKWGTCNPKDRRIWLNLELAKKPHECLEYIVVHEMAHLIEPSHNKRFISLMDLFLPKWKLYRDELNKLPVGHEDWKY